MSSKVNVGFYTRKSENKSVGGIKSPGQLHRPAPVPVPKPPAANRNKGYLSQFTPGKETGQPIDRNAQITFLPAVIPDGLSRQAREIHQYFAGGLEAVSHREIVKRFGLPLRRPNGLPDALTLRGFPVEELRHYGLVEVREID